MKKKKKSSQKKNKQISKKKNRWLLIISAVIGVFIAIFSFTPIINVLQEEKETTLNQFSLKENSGEAMLAYVKRFVEISPRDSGTLNSGKAQKWLVNEIRKAGLEPEADTWIEPTIEGRKTFCNIYTDYPGETKDTILIGCHYDTKAGIGEGFQGANDGGSTVGVMLELMRQMAENNVKTHHTIRFAFFDGEECIGESYSSHNGLHGSTRMANYYYENEKDILKNVIIIDMVGDKNLVLEIPRNVTPKLAKQAMVAAMENPKAAPVSLATTYCIDDHWPFVERGFSAIDLIDYTYGSTPDSRDYWHTLEDTVDKLSPISLEKTAILVVDILKLIDPPESTTKERNEY